MFKSNLFVFALILILSITVVLFVRYPELRYKYVFNEDIRWVMSWVWRFNDNKEFRDDLISNYTYWRTPSGIKILYYLSSFIANPLLVAKLIPILMFLLTVVFLLILCRHLAGNAAAFFSGLIFILLVWGRNPSELEIFGPGDGGDFYFPLAIIFLYSLTKKKYWLLMFIVLMEAFFYPPLFLISSLTLIAYFTLNKCSRNEFIGGDKKRLLYLVILFTICFSLLLISYGDKKIFGDTFNKKEMTFMPEFYSYGRIPMFLPSFKENLTNDRGGLCLDRSMITLVIISIFLFLLLGKKSLKLFPTIWYFIASAYFLFFLSHILLLKLYLPSRYIGIPTNIFLILFISINIHNLIGKLKLAYLRFAILTIFTILIVVCYVFFIGIKREDTKIQTDEKELLTFLSHLPANSYLAGHPEMMDNVHIFSRKRILISKELSVPFHKIYYNEIKKRTYDFFDAYYSENEEELKNFCSKYKVTHLVVNAAHFRNNYITDSNFYLQPFNEYIIKITKKNRFFLKNIPEEKKVFMQGDLSVIACN